MIDVCILGTGGMMPLPGRHLSSCLLRHDGRSCLIDCGEGTQVALQEYAWRLGGLDLILLTHLHADHVMGLPGVLAHLQVQGREDPLTIVGPKYTLDVLRALMVVMPIGYPVNVLELPKVGELSVGGMAITPIPLSHTMPCFGYHFHLPRPRAFLPEEAKRLGIPVKFWSQLQAGESARQGLKRWKPEDVLGPERPGLDLVFATDTRYTEALEEAARDADLLICEGIYGEHDSERLEKADAAGHIALWPALEMAQRARAREVWFTHFSPSFKNQEELTDELREQSRGLASFAWDGRKTTLNFHD